MISVVIPLYNHRDTIGDTLRSVLAQTRVDFEVVVVDDGSTDGSADVVKSFSDPRIRLVAQENSGVGEARNNGIAQAKGEWIALLDADDLWEPGYLEWTERIIRMRPDAGMICFAGFVMRNGKKYLRTLRPERTEDFYDVDYFQAPLFVAHTSAVVISKKIFDRTRKFAVTLPKSEDHLLFAEMAILAPVVFCRHPLSVCLRGLPGQLARKNRETESKRKALVDIEIYSRFHDLYRRSQNRSLYLTMMYDVRSAIESHLERRDYRYVSQYFLSRADFLRAGVNRLAFFLYRHPSLRRLALFEIFCFKCFYRLLRPRQDYLLIADDGD